MKSFLILFVLIAALVIHNAECNQDEDQSMMPEEEEDLLDSPNLEEIIEQGEQKEQVPLNNAEEEQSSAKDKTAKEETDITNVEEVDKSARADCKKLTITKKVCGTFTTPRRCNKKIQYKVQTAHFHKSSKRVCVYNNFTYNGRKCRSTKYYTVTKYKVTYATVRKYRVLPTTCFVTKKRCKTITFTASPDWKEQIAKN